MQQHKSSSDIKLWSGFIEGDSHSYATLYSLYARGMYHYGLHFTDDYVLVEDAIHDVFVKLYNNRHRLPTQIDNVKLYLFVALKNTLLNISSKRRIELFKLDISDCLLPISDLQTAETKIIHNEQEQSNHQLLFKLEGVLSERQRQVLYYRYIEQLSYKEIAVLMDINVQSAKNMVYCAISKIRESFPNDIALMLICMVVISRVNEIA